MFFGQSLPSQHAHDCHGRKQYPGVKSFGACDSFDCEPFYLRSERIDKKNAPVCLPVTGNTLQKAVGIFVQYLNSFVFVRVHSLCQLRAFVYIFFDKQYLVKGSVDHALGPYG